MHRRLKTLREAAEVSQVTVAKACGVSKSAVCHWEHGRRLPHSAIIRKLAKVLKTTVAEIYGEARAA